MKTIRRAPLARILSSTWTEVIRDSYCEGRLNTEISLQFALVSALEKRFEDLKPARRIFIEPAVKPAGTSNGTTIYPDIVICDAHEAVCFIELKYTPNKLPDRLKDMQSLAAIAGDRDVSITSTRYRGPELGNKASKLSETALFVWAGIHTGDAIQSAEWQDACFDSHYFLEMHAVTRVGQEPACEIFTNAYKYQRNE